MTTPFLVAALSVPLLWLAHRSWGALVAIRRLPDLAPGIPGERPWDGLDEALSR